MTTPVQLAIVGLVVAGAAAYVFRAVWKMCFGKTKSGCGAGCGKCATNIPEAKAEGRFPLPQA